MIVERGSYEYAKLTIGRTGKGQKVSPDSLALPFSLLGPQSRDQLMVKVYTCCLVFT